MFKKITLLIFALAFLALAYCAYPIIKNRYFKNEVKEVIEIDNKKSSDSKAINSNNISEENLKISDPNETENTVKDAIDESGDIENISAKDCDNECENFKDNIADLKYCQDICDLSPIKESENCEKLLDKEKDYCFKNQAVAKIDLKICDLISDSTIKSACKNRVTEELLEQQ